MQEVYSVVSTDLGRKPDLLPAEGYKLFVEKLMGEGISGREIDLMINENPARLLGIEAFGAAVHPK
jgi:hypothetical protein